MAFAEVLTVRFKAPIYTRAGYRGGRVAKELYVVGGSTEGLKPDKVFNLSDKYHFEVATKVNAFLK